nr:NAD-dependent epimerase/dehydratase family protein [Oxalobacteraceae bacterium]
MSQEVAVVTGGAGFIGSHVVDRLLAEGYSVRVIDDLSGGRTENLAHQSNEPALSVTQQDVRNVEPDDHVFRGASLVLHFAGIGDIVPSVPTAAIRFRAVEPSKVNAPPRYTVDPDTAIADTWPLGAGFHDVMAPLDAPTAARLL